jgi:hypothetical protein
MSSLAWAATGSTTGTRRFEEFEQVSCCSKARPRGISKQVLAVRRGAPLGAGPFPFCAFGLVVVTSSGFAPQLKYARPHPHSIKMLHFNATSTGGKLPFLLGNSLHSWHGPCVKVCLAGSAQE